MRSEKLIAVGDNCLDVYLSKDLMTVGGNALNVAAHWRRSGRAARYIGAVGTDVEGDVVIAEIESVGLAADDVERRSGNTAVTLLRDQAGDRRFLLEDFGVAQNYMPSDRHWHTIAGADWVHLGTNANPDLVRRLVSGQAPFSVDGSTTPLALPLAGVPLLFASGPDEATEAVEPLVQKLHAAGAVKVVATCGSRGAFYSDGDALLHAPAMPVSVVDTCGAGDSFIAAFLAAFCCDRKGAAEALGKATQAAAETCLHLGGFPQLPRRIPAWLLEKYADVIARAEA